MSRPIKEAMCVIGGLLYRFCPQSCGSDCQDGHRGAEVIAVQGAEGEKVTGGLLYRFCPQSRGSDCQDGHRGAEVIAVQGDREGRKSQVDSCTCLTLDAVGTPTGCRLRREPWIRLSGRPSRGGGHCGVRGQGRGKITDALSYPSYPRCRPWPSPAE